MVVFCGKHNSAYGEAARISWVYTDKHQSLKSFLVAIAKLFKLLSSRLVSTDNDLSFHQHDKIRCALAMHLEYPSPLGLRTLLIAIYLYTLGIDACCNQTG